MWLSCVVCVLRKLLSFLSESQYRSWSLEFESVKSVMIVLCSSNWDSCIQFYIGVGVSEMMLLCSSNWDSCIRFVSELEFARYRICGEWDDSTVFVRQIRASVVYRSWSLEFVSVKSVMIVLCSSNWDSCIQFCVGAGVEHLWRVRCVHQIESRSV